MSDPDAQDLIKKLKAIASAGGGPIVNQLAEAFAKSLDVMHRQSELITQLQQEVAALKEEMRYQVDYHGRIQ